MADPLTILGAAAASFQFAGYAIKGLLKATELAHEIHDAPQRMSQYLGYIDREVASVNDLLRPDSHTFNQLSTTQYAQISKPAIEARKLMQEIQQDLQPLAKISQDPPGFRKQWNVIARTWKSLKNEKDLENKLKRLERLNATLLRELEISGFETQSLLRDQGLEILGIVTSSAADTRESRQLIQQNNAQQSQLIDVIRSREECMSRNVDALRQDIAGSQASANQSMIEVKGGIDTLGREIRGNAELHSSQLRANLSNFEQLFPRLEAIESLVSLIPDIRNELQASSTISTKQQSHMYNPPVKSGDSTFEVDLQKGTARLEIPSHTTQLDPNSSSDERLSRRVCRCSRGGLSKTLWTCGKLGFRSETQTVNWCPKHGKKYARSFSIETKLSPFLMGTLEFTLGLLSGKKGWEMAPPIKFRAVVRRSESPIFRLFDSFHKFAFTQEMVKLEPRRTVINEEADRVRAREKLYVGKLDEMARLIETFIETGQASGSDVDEDGRTLLMEIIWLACRRGIISYAGDQMNRLIRIANLSGVDPKATISVENQDRSGLERLRLTNGPYSAIQFLLDECQWSSRMESLSFHCSLVEYDGLTDSLQGSKSFQFAEERQFIIRSHPQMAEGLGYSDLCLAIVRRSLSNLERLYVDNQFKRRYKGEASPIELAVGWPNGLRFLVDRGCEIEGAFEIACDNRDLESASILLSTNRSISEKHFLVHALEYMPIFRIVMAELWRRREDFIALALCYLDQEERDKLGLSDPWLSDEDSREIDHLLRQKTEVPERLTGAMEIQPHCSGNFPGYTVDHHNIAYDTGFVNVTMLCKSGGTPLSAACRDFLYSDGIVYKYDRWLERVVWLLERGASPESCPPYFEREHWPHLLFYLSLKFPFQGPNRRIKGLCGYDFITDQCKCFCSQRGCTPPFMLWRCGDWYRLCERDKCKKRFKNRLANLRRWIQEWNFSRLEKERCYREICQLELFGRFGMRHTCCCRPNKIDFDAKEIRSEDRVSAFQLEKLLRLYEIMRKLLFNYPIEEFWAFWWKTIDGILPPLLPEEACRWIPLWEIAEKTRIKKVAAAAAASKERDEKWTYMLDAAGYNGLDFEDVIRCHSVKLWVFCKTLAERRRRWKRHRLVGRPASLKLRWGRS